MTEDTKSRGGRIPVSGHHGGTGPEIEESRSEGLRTLRPAAETGQRAPATAAARSAAPAPLPPAAARAPHQARGRRSEFRPSSEPARRALPARAGDTCPSALTSFRPGQSAKPGKPRSSHSPSPELAAASPRGSGASGSSASGRGEGGAEGGGRSLEPPPPPPPPRYRVGTVLAPPRPPPPRLPASAPARSRDAHRTRRIEPVRPHPVRSRAGLNRKPPLWRL